MKELLTIIMCVFFVAIGVTKSHAMSVPHVIAITSGSRAAAFANFMNAADKEELARDPIYGDALKRHNQAVEEDNSRYRSDHPTKWFLYNLGWGIVFGAFLTLVIIGLGVGLA